MWLVKRNDYSPASLDRYFGRFWLDHPFFRSSELEEDSVAWSPRIDVKESEEAFKVLADLPGLKKDDIKLVVKDNMLTLEGERKFEREAETLEESQNPNSEPVLTIDEDPSQVGEDCSEESQIDN